MTFMAKKRLCESCFGVGRLDVGGTSQEGHECEACGGTGEVPLVTVDLFGSKRKKSSYVGVPAIFELTMACNVLIKAFGHTVYHVGSSLERPDWRDVDLVMIMPDDAFFQEFPNVPRSALKNASWELDPKWLVMTSALSKWLSARGGVAVDFKFQPMTYANERHDGPRSAIGLFITNPDKDEE